MPLVFGFVIVAFAGFWLGLLSSEVINKLWYLGLLAFGAYVYFRLRKV